MNFSLFLSMQLIIILLLSGCSDSASVNAPLIDPSEQWPGDKTTVDLRRPSFLEPVANLSRERQKEFYIGFSFFRDPWVIAPSATSDRDGLGPIFNARACIVCHPKGGRGRPPSNTDEPMLSMFLRLSIPGENKQGGVVPEPIYGDQLQVRGISLKNNFGLARSNGVAQGDGVIGEAHSYVEYEIINGKYVDGESWSLRKPTYQIRDVAWGEMHPDTQFSPRMAPQLAGLGLLEAINEQEILAYVDPEDKNADGISGRANRVWDVEKGETVLGRFGLKASQPNLSQQTAAAFRGDIGITNDLFSAQPCRDAQTTCLKTRHGVDPKTGVEIKRDLLDAVTFFGRMLAVPKRRHWQAKKVRVGRELFYQANCHHCHVPSYTTANDALEPELAGQKIWPYSDLLLHDMGDGLADGRSDFEANGNEWRTAPLWGIGLSEQVSGNAFYLHDGRARSISEAILWHGGEAQAARDVFVTMNRQERQALSAFVKSL